MPKIIMGTELASRMGAYRSVTAIASLLIFCWLIELYGHHNLHILSLDHHACFQLSENLQIALHVRLKSSGSHFTTVPTMKGIDWTDKEQCQPETFIASSCASCS